MTTFHSRKEKSHSTANRYMIYGPQKNNVASSFFQKFWEIVFPLSSGPIQRVEEQADGQNGPKKWNVSKVRVTVLNRAQWSSGHMQGWCSVGAWVQQNVWILHKPKEGGKNTGTSRQESQHSLVSALMRMVSAAQHAWDYARLRVCVIIARCVSVVVCGSRSAWAWQLGSRQNPGDLNPTCCLTLSADGGSRETAI